MPTNLRHNILLDIVKRLPSDFEPYGERARLEMTDSDCSCGCRWFLPLAGDLQYDWGVCSNPRSPRCGLCTFEHQGCREFEDAVSDVDALEPVSFTTLPCPACGQTTLLHVVEDCPLSAGRLVTRVAHIRCTACGERFFDVAAMKLIQATPSSQRTAGPDASTLTRAEAAAVSTAWHQRLQGRHCTDSTRFIREDRGSRRRRRPVTRAYGRRRRLRTRDTAGTLSLTPDQLAAVRAIEVTPSCGNVFADLGLDHPEELLAQADRRISRQAALRLPLWRQGLQCRRRSHFARARGRGRKLCTRYTAGTLSLPPDQLAVILAEEITRRLPLWRRALQCRQET